MLDSDADDDECDDGGSGDHDGFDSIMKFESMHVFISFECENQIITVSFWLYAQNEHNVNLIAF